MDQISAGKKIRQRSEPVVKSGCIVGYGLGRFICLNG
jgi:hypothetical protein